MADQEKQTLSEKVATLAEAQGIDSALLWEAAKTCPQGHDSCGEAIGQVCMVCVFRATPGIKEEYIMHQFLEGHPGERPEWRFGRQAKDMTDPAALLPVVEAWRDQNKWRVWKVESAGESKDALRTMAMGYLVDEKGYETHGFDDDPMIAMAQALCAMLDAEKGDRI